MDNVYLDQGLLNQLFGRFRFWRKYIRPGHWERWSRDGHGWAKVDHWFEPWGDGEGRIYMRNCRAPSPWGNDQSYLICEDYLHPLPSARIVGRG